MQNYKLFANYKRNSKKTRNFALTTASWRKPQSTLTCKTFIRKLCCRYVWVNLTLMALVVAALVAAASFATDVYTHHGEEIAIPDLRGKRYADARHLLADAGLVIAVADSGYNRLLPPDCILQQQPAPGEHVKSGRLIYVTLNTSQKPTLLFPDIIDNSSLREAMARLRIAGFKVGEPQLIPGEKDWVYGAVCRGRRLAVGDRVAKDAMVTLQVGNGQLSADADLEVTDADIVDEGDDPTAEDPFEEVTTPH